jgi:site-specific recombinase XerD
MKYTFKLKEPKGNKETLILFCCEFKAENKRFVYSTGEHVHPTNWDVSTRFPFLKGETKPKNFETLKMMLDRYSVLFNETESLYKRINENFTSEVLRSAFDETFKRTVKGKNVFFDAYDKFIVDRIETWAKSTVKSYENVKNILINFEKKKNFPLTFTKIDKTFYAKFGLYCQEDLGHIDNTHNRNLVLFKSFMYWATEKNYTFNKAFIDFKNEKKVITTQIALTIEDINKLLSHEFDSKTMEKARDVFVFACVTGMRFGELSLIKRSNVTKDCIILKEKKDTSKVAREIPLTNISRYILAKYDYNLPLTAIQNQNKNLKEIFKELKYTHLVEKVTTRRKENITIDMNFYDRISTHTARRTYITMMKKKGKSDKLIASISGHKDMRTLNSYYQVDGDERKKAMDDVFNIEVPLKKVNDL